VKQVSTAFGRGSRTFENRFLQDEGEEDRFDPLRVMMERLHMEVLGGIFWAAVGVFFAVGALKLGLGTFPSPGPGFIPLGIALLLISCSLLTVVKAVIRSPGQGMEILWKRPALVIASVFIYMLLLSIVGFLPSTFVLMAILFGLLIAGKKHRWLHVFFFAAAAAVGTWVVFSLVLRIPFP